MTESKNLAANYAALKAQLVAELFGSVPRQKIYLAPNPTGVDLSASTIPMLLRGSVVMFEIFPDAWLPTPNSDALSTKRGGYGLLHEIIQNLSQSENR